jgi:hypothetical protein
MTANKSKNAARNRLFIVDRDLGNYGTEITFYRLNEKILKMNKNHLDNHQQRDVNILKFYNQAHPVNW